MTKRDNQIKNNNSLMKEASKALSAIFNYLESLIDSLQQLLRLLAS